MSKIKHRGKAWAWETTGENIIRRRIIYPSMSRTQMEKMRTHIEGQNGPVKLIRVQQYSFI